MGVDPIKSLFLKDLDDESNRISSETTAKPAGSELMRNDVKSFSLFGQGSQKTEGIQEQAPSLMELVGKRQDKGGAPEEFRLDPDEKLSRQLRENINRLKEELNDFQLQAQNSYRTQQIEKERYDAMTLVMGLINEDLQTVANETGQTYSVGKEKEECDDRSVGRKIIDWVSTGEEVLNRAMIYLSGKQGEPESITDFLKLQYAVQRATQRAELFASIVGTSVSSIKTIMTTQLG